MSERHGAENDGPRTFRQEADGTWQPAVPLPYFLPFGLKRCGHSTPARDDGCGRKFWRMAAYETHYRIEHTRPIPPTKPGEDA